MGVVAIDRYLYGNNRIRGLFRPDLLAPALVPVWDHERTSSQDRIYSQTHANMYM